MREVWRMWNYATMLVLTVLTASLFAAILIPFKGIPLIPGLTELRPANVIPLVFGLLFGPAGAWGAAFGNLIGDFFGTLGIGSLFGFWGNFLAAYLPYKMWQDRPLSQISHHLPRFFGAVLLGALSCALVVGFGLETFKLLPFSVIAVAILVNNGLVSLVLGPLLLRLLAPRVSRWDLAWRDQMDPEDCPGGAGAAAGPDPGVAGGRRRLSHRPGPGAGSGEPARETSPGAGAGPIRGTALRWLFAAVSPGFP